MVVELQGADGLCPCVSKGKRIFLSNNSSSQSDDRARQKLSTTGCITILMLCSAFRSDNTVLGQTQSLSHPSWNQCKKPCF